MMLFQVNVIQLDNASQEEALLLVVVPLGLVFAAIILSHLAPVQQPSLRIIPT